LYSLSPNNPLNNYLTADNRSAPDRMRIHDLPADQSGELAQTLAKAREKKVP